MRSATLCALALLGAAPGGSRAAFSSLAKERSGGGIAPPTTVHRPPPTRRVTAAAEDRPLLRKFGRGIKARIVRSEEGTNRCGQAGAYTSEETIPCLDMQCGGSGCGVDGYPSRVVPSSRRAIREAFTESSRIHSFNDGSCESARQALPHGRSSGSGCTIVRLTGEDAASIRGLTDYSARFFERVDDGDGRSDGIERAGVFQIDKHVYAGFDADVNDAGTMQFLDTRRLQASDDDPMLIPMEVEELVGRSSTADAHRGMDVLLDIGTQITSAVLDMDAESAGKLIDDGTHVPRPGGALGWGDVSNSYHRLIRYLKPQRGSEAAAFDAHVDSSFLTLIPMPELPGLEVWCPANERSGGDDGRHGGGEWVRPHIDEGDRSDSTAYVIAMAGEFLQLTSNGEVPTCIHRVIPPRAPPASSGAAYKPRISAPMFLRPRRGDAALLDVRSDLRLVDQGGGGGAGDESGLYFEEGLIDECDEMHLWSAHNIMMSR